MNYLNLTLFCFLLSLLLPSCKSEYQTSDLISSFEKQNKPFKVKVSAFKEVRGFGKALAGANYIYEVKVNEKNWEKIMEVQSDDPIPINENSIFFPKDEVGYIFFINKYAVTLDGGATWNVWDLQQIPSISFDKTCIIQDIKVDEEGRGKMTLRCNTANKFLFSIDFGINWFEKSLSDF